MSESDKSQSTPLPRTVEEEILLAVCSVRYGAVEVIIHDSQVVQIQRTEKVRFENASTVKAVRSA